MAAFHSRSVAFSGTIRLAGPVDLVFELFSPLGEKHWVPGWNPELLHPPDAVWDEGLIFRTREDSGDAIWSITRLKRVRHAVEYQRVEPDRYVARVAVTCEPAGETATDATVRYQFIGLSERGNADIDAMTASDYAKKMTRWTQWINDYLARLAKQ